jgi:hypothetical protein
MLSTSRRPVAPRAYSDLSLLARARDGVALPFTHRFAAPLWLGVRLYLAVMWFQMGVAKFAAGFLSSDPIGGILKLVADGTLAVPVAAFRPVAAMLVNLGTTPLLSFSMPFLELAVALALLTGVVVVPAAIGATLLNVVFILSGIGQLGLDGRFIALQLLLVLAFRVGSTIGVEPLLARLTRPLLRTLRRRPATA